MSGAMRTIGHEIVSVAQSDVNSMVRADRIPGGLRRRPINNEIDRSAPNIREKLLVLSPNVIIQVDELPSLNAPYIQVMRSKYRIALKVTERRMTYAEIEDTINRFLAGNFTGGRINVDGARPQSPRSIVPRIHKPQVVGELRRDIIVPDREDYGLLSTRAFNQFVNRSFDKGRTDAEIIHMIVNNDTMREHTMSLALIGTGDVDRLKRELAGVLPDLKTRWMTSRRSRGL